MKKIFLAILFVMATIVSNSQTIQTGSLKVHAVKNDYSVEKKPTVVYSRIEGNDTILIVYLPEVDIDLMSRYFEIRETRQGRRLINNVKTVFPYAQLAANKLHEYDTLLCQTTSDKARRQMMKDAEDQLTSQYTKELERLTLTQGAILIRLIDRQTGNTSYKLVQELRGKMRAAFYQGFARLWGYNLKNEFDPKNNREDEEIDVIATLLERGQI